MNFSFIHFCSLDFEECAHKLLKMQINDEQLVSGGDVMDFIWSTFPINCAWFKLNNNATCHCATNWEYKLHVCSHNSTL